MTYRIELSPERPDPDTPSAQEMYRALRRDPAAETGKRVKTLLERLRDDPAGVRAQSKAFHPGVWWVAEMEMPDESVWWIVWRLDPAKPCIKVRRIGPNPPDFVM